MGAFYKYIVKRKDKYCIVKNGITFGTYDDITNALHDRDLLVEYEWDLSEVLAQDEKPNKYKSMELPPCDRYITKQRVQKYVYYTIQKVINGEKRRFGYFKTFEEAVRRRDELEANGWVK